MKTMVIALGGNAIKRQEEKGEAKEQLENIRRSCFHIVKLIKKGFHIVITHGNGPQVGSLLIQQEEASRIVPAQPIDVCDAMTQGQIGYMIQQALVNELQDARMDRHVATLITQVIVDKEDPAFKNPTKPIGPFYTRPQKEKCERQGGHVFSRVKARGEFYRRVVPSPNPLRIVESKMVKELLESRVIVIASGGGGIPVVLDRRGHLCGVEAVVDKDLAGEKLAESIGADLFMILTDVNQVFLNFGTKRQRKIKTLYLENARRYLKEGQFPSGTMGPKVEACIRFLEYGGEKAIITCLDCADKALDGREGTSLLP